jgi:predicted TIM-barrel fold metal-dependent hydrolase
MPTHDESKFPHSPDVIERQTVDDGFSAGWGSHHQPAETYILDCHTHMFAKTKEDVQKAINLFYERAGAMRLRCHIALDGWPENADVFSQVSEADDRFLWLARLRYDQPDIKFLKEASKKKGFCGLKLHNKDMIEEGALPSVWNKPEWQEIFTLLGELDKPVMWHVTQRRTDCPYMGGGRDSYWKLGWPKGVKYSNQDVLNTFLEQVTNHSKTKFIGAHHLHISPDRVGKLLQKYANLFVDYSCGNMLRPFDDLYESDRECWRTHTIKFQDRILFGTDCAHGKTAGMWYLWETLAAHIRFLHQLHLPKEVLEKVAHENIERIIGIQPLPLKPELWMFVRP